MYEAFSDLSNGNLALLALIVVAFIVIFFVLLKRLVGIAFWVLVLFVVLIAGFSIYDDKLAASVKQLVVPDQSNTESLQTRFSRVYDLLKIDSSEVLSKWKFLWSPSINKDTTPEQRNALPPPPPPAPIEPSQTPAPINDSDRS